MTTLHESGICALPPPKKKIIQTNFDTPPKNILSPLPKNYDPPPKKKLITPPPPPLKIIPQDKQHLLSTCI